MPTPPGNRQSAAQQSLLGFELDQSGFKLDNIDRRIEGPQPLNLFFAIFPERADAQRIALAAKDLRDAHELTGRLIHSDRLHMSLHSIGTFVDFVPKAIIEAARGAAGRVDCSRFNVVLDQVQSYAKNSDPRSNPFVLIPDTKSTEAIARLRQHLAILLRKANLHPQASNNPHMTLLYDKERIAPHPVDQVIWMATRFALILSHEGQTHHQWVGEWALANTR